MDQPEWRIFEEQGDEPGDEVVERPISQVGQLTRKNLPAVDNVIGLIPGGNVAQIWKKPGQIDDDRNEVNIECRLLQQLCDALPNPMPEYLDWLVFLGSVRLLLGLSLAGHPLVGLLVCGIFFLAHQEPSSIKKQSIITGLCTITAFTSYSSLYAADDSLELAILSNNYRLICTETSDPLS